MTTNKENKTTLMTDEEFARLLQETFACEGCQVCNPRCIYVQRFKMLARQLGAVNSRR